MSSSPTAPLFCNTLYVGFEVLTAVVMKAAILSDIGLCSPYANRRFGRMQTSSWVKKRRIRNFRELTEHKWLQSQNTNSKAKGDGLHRRDLQRRSSVS
jgi:hypothetical protein